MPIFLLLGTAFKFCTGLFTNIITVIWSNPVLRYGTLLLLALGIAFFYGGHIVKERDEAVAKEAAYQATIASLKKSLALQQALTAQNEADQQISADLLQKQATSLKTYQDYLATLSVKGAKNGPDSPCIVDKHLLDAIGVRN